MYITYFLIPKLTSQPTHLHSQLRLAKLMLVQVSCPVTHPHPTHISQNKFSIQNPNLSKIS